MVELAGQHVAERYLNMPLQGVDYHVHEGKSDDSYVRWISENRLPLTAALEGMGSDSDKWDDAHLTSVTSEPGQLRPPDVFSMVNVLKGEYLVARRLAFDSLSALASGDNVGDSGTYVDTVDDAIYGHSAQALVLAHRSALDLLDKIAVAVNHYLLVGDDPAKVSFKGFWAKRGSDRMRKELVSKCPESRAPSLRSRSSRWTSRRTVFTRERRPLGTRGPIGS
ncbi:LA2681 family HEPN domain-containing protein [Actinomycetospora sp. OC33-EN08]|uniref:LA2681 family HEPN domain-containing protein n=1 Tax=Actinomycetospora aurantiaca TaxID=3129233 RepID=A0ABU8MFK0_9PSEU